MELLPAGRESNHYNEEEDMDEPLNHHQNFALPPPPSSSSSSSSPPLWEEHHTTAGSGSGSGNPLTAPMVEKEYMFDKVVTPSDVGKLNRLVIPKQHAEKYFPLDAATSDKGLLLSFEDRTGKLWRFRYSYWNSSQSYVMTKGWSRFVKDKRLDAGDTVSFGRGVGEAGRHRLFIDWKRRPQLPFPYHRGPSSSAPFVVPWGRIVMAPPTPTFPTMTSYEQLCYDGHSSGVSSNPYLYLRSGATSSQVMVQLGISGGPAGDGGERGGAETMGFDSAVQRKAAPPKTVRLFGVNLGCSPSEHEPGGDAAAYRHPPPPPPVLPLQLRLGTSEVVEPPWIERRATSTALEY